MYIYTYNLFHSDIVTSMCASHRRDDLLELNHLMFSSPGKTTSSSISFLMLPIVFCKVDASRDFFSVHFGIFIGIILVCRIVETNFNGYNYKTFLVLRLEENYIRNRKTVGVRGSGSLMGLCFIVISEAIVINNY